MADELKQSQLARIVAPAITDVKYAEGMADAFDKINDNFKKIASLPFLQGVQGDSYQLEEYSIWEKDDMRNWILTEDGKVLLNSIFERDVTRKEDDTFVYSFEEIKENIGEKLDSVSPIDFFGSGSGEPLHNTLYFYVIKDDANNVIEKQLGQFYYFIDARLKNIGKVYGDETLSVFNDYTGFYQYRYNPKSYEQKYLRIDILPSIYYDRDKNDICWKFNGNETGISAIGIEGQSGKDADLSIVLVVANPDDFSSMVLAEFNYLQKDNNANYGIYWDDDVSKIKEGKAIICCKTVDENKNDDVLFNFAYGELIKGDDSVLNAYWNPGTMYSHVIDNMKITSYFYGMGENTIPSAPHYLAIPSDSNRSTGSNKNSAHVIRNIGTSSGSIGDLEFVNTSNAFNATGGQKPDPKPISKIKDIKLSNYNLKVGDDENTSKKSNVYITKDSVKIGPTSYIGPTGAVINGGLEVSPRISTGNLIVGNKSNPGKTDIYGEANIYDEKGIVGINFKEKNITAKGNITGEGNITAKGDIIGESGANIEGDIIIGGNTRMSKKVIIDGLATMDGGATINNDVFISGNTTINNNTNIKGILINEKAIINSAKLSLEYRYIIDESCFRFKEQYDNGDDINVWLLKDKESVCQILYFDENRNDGYNAIAFPATYPSYTTVMVLFNDKNNQHFNFIRDTKKDENGEDVMVNGKAVMVPINKDDIGVKGSAMYFVCLGGGTYHIRDYECRKIDMVYTFNTTIYGK